MPLSFRSINKRRLCLFALVLLAPLFLADLHADAQKSRSAQKSNPPAIANASQSQKKNLTRLNASDTAEGSSLIIVSDLPLNDYSAYRSGDRFYVLIPSADASRIANGLRGRGFQDVRAQKRGNDVLLSFRLVAGATARVSQKFNRLEILITVPALVAANSAASANNSNTGTQTNPPGSVASASGANTNTRTPSGSGNAVRYGNNSSGTTGTGAGTYSQSTATNPSNTNAPDGIPVGADGGSTPPGTSGFPADAQASPMMSPVASPTAEQIAQVQQAPGIAETTSQAPSTTSNPAPSVGSTFGAQVKQNWLFILLAVAIAGLIAWVLFARSRADRVVVEDHIKTIRESRPKAVAVTTPLQKPIEPAVVSQPAKVETKYGIAEADLVPPVVTAPIVDEAEEESAEKEIEAAVIESPKPVAVEQASADVASLLDGGQYLDATIGTQHPAARQMIAAELLAALAGRNLVRRERAREAYIKHGFFDDATRTLRTAQSPAERASSARSLGLVRDESATPHLVAALEDSSPDVRRAAVESLAEVRDPAAVAALEAMRDSEKDRKIPTALIQHAIEASVIGRMKAEVTSPLVPPDEQEAASFDTEPLSDDAELDVAAGKQDEAFELGYETIDEPAAVEDAPPVELTEAEVGAETYDVIDSTLPDTPSIEMGMVTEPIEVEEPVVEHAVSTSDEWVDVDVGRPSTRSILFQPSLEEAGLSLPTGDSTEAVVPDIAAEELGIQTEPLFAESETSPLPFVSAEAVVAEAATSESVSDEEVGIVVAGADDKEIEIADEDQDQDQDQDQGGVPVNILRRLASEDSSERVRAIEALGRIGGEDSFREISASFDDSSPEVRDAAARALFSLNPDRAASFTRALREATPERRRNIGGALSSSGLATEAISHLMGESREKTYDAFSLLFLMAKAGEVQPLMHAVEEHPNNEVRLAVVKLLALSGQQEILPAFRRLAVRGSLPTEVRSAVMEAIYQISSQSSGATS